MSRTVSVGSRVRLLNETGEGTVSGFTKEGYALVMLDDGFEIPFPKNQVVVVGGVAKSETAPESSRPAGENSLHESLFLAIVFEGLKNDEPMLSVRLANLRKEALFVTLYSQAEKQFVLEGSLELKETSSFKLFSCSMPELLQRDRFYIQVIPLIKKTAVVPAPWTGFVKYQQPVLASPQLWPSDELFGQKTLFIEVYPEPKLVPPVSIQPKHIAHISHTLSANQHPDDWLIRTDKNGNYEVDLHIEEILENTAGMEHSEIIRFQIRHFEKSLDEARRRRLKKFVAIHGIGKGRLKDEIRKILTAEKIEHYDGSHQRYGYGATEIVVR